MTEDVAVTRAPAVRRWWGAAPRRAARRWALVAHRPGAVVAVWLVTRAVIAMAGLEHLPYPRNDVLYNDVEVYASWSDRLADGSFPSDDPMWQYPPLAGLVFVLPRLTPVGAYVGFVWLALLADLAILLVLLVDGRRRGGRLSGAWLWAFTALLVGPIMLGRFDVVPTFFAVAALAAAARPVRAGLWAAIGSMLKVWPVMMLLALPRRRLPVALLSFGVTAVALLVAVRAWGRGSMSFLGFQAERGLQIESVGALPYLVANWAGGFVSRAYQYGAMEITNPGSRTVATTITGLGVLLLLVLAGQRLAGRLEPVPPADVALTAVLVAVATSRVFSPSTASGCSVSAPCAWPTAGRGCGGPSRWSRSPPCPPSCCTRSGTAPCWRASGTPSSRRRCGSCCCWRPPPWPATG